MAQLNAWKYKSDSEWLGKNIIITKGESGNVFSNLVFFQRNQLCTLLKHYTMISHAV